MKEETDNAKFKILGFLDNKRKVDCSYKRIKGNNYINICTEGFMLDLVWMQVQIESREDIDRIIDLLQRTRHCFTNN